MFQKIILHFSKITAFKKFGKQLINRQISPLPSPPFSDDPSLSSNQARARGWNIFKIYT